MAWSWSHSNEAYENAYNNLNNLDRDDLVEIATEWDCFDAEESDDDSIFDWDIGRKKYAVYTQEILVNRIWERMSEQSICDNGGFNAWCCPYGCHTVSFDEENNN